MRRQTLLAGVFAGLTAAGAAFAHTPYLAPSTFAPDRDYVTVQAALTEGNFFVPDFPIRGEGDYLAIGPSGETVTLKPAAVLKEAAYIEAPLAKEGTWRVTTGDRAGRATKWAKVEGQWRMVRPAGSPPMRARPAGEGEGDAPARAGPIDEAAVPAGSQAIQSQGFTKAETYVTRGAPSRGALKATGQGFELEPKTHPNEIFAGEPFAFRFLTDGKPAADVKFSVAKAGDAYSEKRYSFNGAAGADGAVSLVLDQPGVYVLEARYPERSEDPAAPPAARTTTYSLSFEVTR